MFAISSSSRMVNVLMFVGQMRILDARSHGDIPEDLRQAYFEEVRGMAG